MLQDKEGEIRLLFLEEAQEYLNTIESIILELSADGSDEKMNAALRAAHSIKGGSAMMGFQVLSHLAHRLEDFLKVLKTQKLSTDTELESLLLSGVDHLRSCIALNCQGTEVDEQWLDRVNPVFDQLYQLLGSSAVEDKALQILPEDDQDMVAMIFATEVEGCLQRLETVLANPEKPCLLEEISIMAQELGGLGEMLQLTAFKDLCDSITQNLEASPERVEEIAPLALQEWRRAQAALLMGQVDVLPTQLASSVNHSTETELLQFDEADFGDAQESEVNEVNATPAAVARQENVNPEQDELVRFSPSFEYSDIQDSESQPVLFVSDSDFSPATELKETQENTVRVPLKQLEQLNDLFGELTIERNGMNIYLQRLRNQVKTLKHRVRALQSLDTDRNVQRSGNGASPEDLHASPEVVEKIVRIQEVTDDLNLALEDTNQIVGQLNRTAKQLQTAITQVRMRPLSDLVGRFPRFIRELSLQYGKKVELKTQDAATLVDRTILETLADPLTHLLRNAFDHGIEDPATRQALGKPERGVIEITAAHRGNQTLIAVSDDGGGIDLDKVRRQAMHLGLDAAAIAAASDHELLTLIFEPGFSTALQVTALSGRGVGMDVVRTNLRKIRGDIKVATQLGKGTTFTLSVPLTLSVARVLLVESNGMPLAFPTDAIQEMLLLEREDIFTVAGNEVLSWQGSITPLIRLGQWLEIRYPHRSADVVSEVMPIMSTPTVLIVSQGNEWVGIQVDRCWGEQEVAIRRVEGSISMPPGFVGCTVLGDGRVVPLVNVSELLHWIASCKQSHSLKRSSKASTHAERSQKNTILVVDDSINVRRFLGLTLEKAGYQVEQAKDGQDALEKLLNGLQIRAVICDIDMPRLDGYGLLARVKSNPMLKQVPVAMLTSRAGQQDRQLAMELGAAAYFCKPYNEQELLQMLRELVQN